MMQVCAVSLKNSFLDLKPKTDMLLRNTSTDVSTLFLTVQTDF